MCAADRRGDPNVQRAASGGGEVTNPLYAPRAEYDPGGPSETKQFPGVGLETQAVVEKYYITGTLDAWNSNPGRYGDFSGVGSYQDCLNRVLEAQESFEALPADIRGHFNNDPAELLAAADDPGRQAELVGLGLIPRGAPEVVAAVPAATPAAAPSGASPPEAKSHLPNT